MFFLNITFNYTHFMFQTRTLRIQYSVQGQLNPRPDRDPLRVSNYLGFIILHSVLQEESSKMHQNFRPNKCILRRDVIKFF